jgi:hypothetical protein
MTSTIKRVEPKQRTGMNNGALKEARETSVRGGVLTPETA